MDAIDARRAALGSKEEFRAVHGLDGRPVVACLAGSRRSEIGYNLPFMVELSGRFPQYQFVVAGVPWLDRSVYEPLIAGSPAMLLACALLFAGALAPQADLFGAIYTALLQPDGRDYALRYTWEGEPAAATLPAGCAPAYQPPGYTADRDAAITTETEYYRQYTRTSAGRGARWYTVRLAVITADLQENYDGRSSVYTTLNLNNRTVQLGIQSDVWGDTIFTLFWETAGIHHTVQGNAPLTELIQVAESISYALPPRLRHGERNLSLES